MGGEDQPLFVQEVVHPVGDQVKVQEYVVVGDEGFHVLDIAWMEDGPVPAQSSGLGLSFEVFAHGGDQDVVDGFGSGVQEPDAPSLVDV